MIEVRSEPFVPYGDTVPIRPRRESMVDGDPPPPYLPSAEAESAPSQTVTTLSAAPRDKPVDAEPLPYPVFVYRPIAKADARATRLTRFKAWLRRLLTR